MATRGTSLSELVEELLAQQARVEAALQQRAPGITPHTARVLGWLGRHRSGTLRHIAAGTDMGTTTVRKAVARLITAGLARWVDGPPRRGRPVDSKPGAGTVELTALGLRMNDRMRAPID